MPKEDPRPTARTKKTQIKIKQHKGGAFRIYINGDYMGAGLTAEAAREGAKRMLVIHERLRIDAKIV
jgi:hypothetical protein